MRVLAVDPGYDRMGVAVLEKQHNGKEALLFSDCLTTSPKTDFYDRLTYLGTELEHIIETWKPNYFAFEKLFFAKNQKTAIAVAEVRGMLGFIATRHSLPIHEYTPMQIKVAVAGYGKADKKQISQMVVALCKPKKPIKYDDEYDAIAIGITAIASVR